MEELGEPAPNNHESVRRSDTSHVVLALGMMLMLVAFASCAVLSWSHIQEAPVVGCGGGVELGGSAAQAAESGCDRAKDSIWSSAPSGWLANGPRRNGVVCCHGPVLDHWSGAFGGASAGTLGQWRHCS